MDELAELLAANNPGLREAQIVLGSSKITLGEFELTRHGDSKTALGYLNRNLELRRELLRRDPKDDQAKRGVCNALGYLAKLWLKVGDPGKAGDCYNEEVALRDQLGPEVAGMLETRREGAGLQEKLGDWKVAHGDKIAGRDHYDRSLKIREETARENPGHMPAHRDVQLSYKKIGTFYLLQLDDPAAAVAFFQKARAEFERRYEAEPKSVIAREDLALIEYYFATAALRTGDRKTADRHYKACLAIREGLAGDPKAKLDVIDLMIARARCGQHELASKTAKEQIASPPTDARVYFQAACGFSLCAWGRRRTAGDTGIKGPRGELYRERASSRFAWRSAAGWKNLVDVQTDPDLDAIRAAPGFEAVVALFRQADGSKAQ